MITLKKLSANLNKIPESPGIYIFRTKNKIPIYIGKAVNLRKRLVSHFLKKGKSYNVLEGSYFLDLKPTESEIEALLLEADLIKHFRPKYNVREKDDKSFLYLVIRNGDFPYIEFSRERSLNLKAKDLSFGPFTEGKTLREAIRILRGIFSYRDCKPMLFLKAKKDQHPCLYFSLGKCSAPCLESTIDKADYQKLIKEMILFLKNKKDKLIKNWQKEMKKLSSNKKYEEAAAVRDRLKSIERIKKFHFIEDSVPQSKRKIKIEVYDVAQIFGEARSGGMVVFLGKLSEGNVILGKFSKDDFRKFKLEKGKGDLALLKEMLERRFKHSEWLYPDLILIDGGLNQLRIAQSVFKKYSLDIPVVGITKGKKHKAEKPTLPFDRFKWPYLVDLVKKNWLLFVSLDEKAHKFVQSYHQLLHQKKFKI